MLSSFQLPATIIKVMKILYSMWCCWVLVHIHCTNVFWNNIRRAIFRTLFSISNSNLQLRLLPHAPFWFSLSLYFLSSPSLYFFDVFFDKVFRMHKIATITHNPNRNENNFLSFGISSVVGAICWCNDNIKQNKQTNNNNKKLFE